MVIKVKGVMDNINERGDIEAIMLKGLNPSSNRWGGGDGKH